jgi:metal-sulfur cluster biosynthetic enzyme
MIDEPNTEDLGASATGVVAEAPPAARAAQVTAEPGSAIPLEELARLSEDIVGALKTVYDPEIPADIYELGLIYKVDVDDERVVKVDMTLTTPNCPSAAELPAMVENAVASSTCGELRAACRRTTSKRDVSECDC